MGYALVNTEEAIHAAKACIADIETSRLNDWNNAIASQMKERKLTWRFWKKETYTKEEAIKFLSENRGFDPFPKRHMIFTYRSASYYRAKRILLGAKTCKEDTLYLSLSELALLKPYWS